LAGNDFPLPNEQSPTGDGRAAPARQRRANAPATTAAVIIMHNMITRTLCNLTHQTAGQSPRQAFFGFNKQIKRHIPRNRSCRKTACPEWQKTPVVKPLTSLEKLEGSSQSGFSRWGFRLFDRRLSFAYGTGEYLFIAVKSENAVCGSVFPRLGGVACYNRCE